MLVKYKTWVCMQNYAILTFSQQQSFLQWQKRFFILTRNKQLQYFKNEKDKRPVKDPIDLRSVTCIEASLQHKSFKHVFSINTKGRIYYLVADSQEEMEKWVEKLCEVCGFQRQDGPNSPRNSPGKLNLKLPMEMEVLPVTKNKRLSQQSALGALTFLRSFVTGKANFCSHLLTF